MRRRRDLVALTAGTLFGPPSVKDALRSFANVRFNGLSNLPQTTFPGSRPTSTFVVQLLTVIERYKASPFDSGDVHEDIL
jgi:hypothetical protein